MPVDRDDGGASAFGRPVERATRWFAAHELRTPLQAIQGGVALLLEEQGHGLSPLQLEAVSVIAAAAAALERCTVRLAELTALDDAPTIAPSVVSLDVLLLEPDASSRPRVTLAGDSAVGIWVLTVPDLVARALAHMATIGGPPGPLAGTLVSQDAETVTLAIRAGRPAAGDGAIAWQLATVLLARAGVAVETSDTGETRLTLRRAARGPI